MLNEKAIEQEESAIKDKLCFTFGNCVLIFDQQIHNLSIQEVQKQIQKKMMNEHNGMTSENIKTIQKKIKDVSMLT